MTKISKPNYTQKATNNTRQNKQPKWQLLQNTHYRMSYSTHKLINQCYTGNKQSNYKH